MKAACTDGALLVANFVGGRREGLRPFQNGLGFCVPALFPAGEQALTELQGPVNAPVGRPAAGIGLHVHTQDFPGLAQAGANLFHLAAVTHGAQKAPVLGFQDVDRPCQTVFGQVGAAQAAGRCMGWIQHLGIGAVPQKGPNPGALGPGQSQGAGRLFRVSRSSWAQAAAAPKIPQVAVACQPRFRWAATPKAMPMRKAVS